MSYVMHLTFFIDASRQDNAERLFNSIKKETSVDLSLECIDPYIIRGGTQFVQHIKYQIKNGLKLFLQGYKPCSHWDMVGV